MRKAMILLSLTFLVFMSGCAAQKFGLVPSPDGMTPIANKKAVELENTFDALIDLEATEYTLNNKIDLRSSDKQKKQLLIVGTDERNRLKEKPIFLFEPETGKVLWTIQSLAPGFNVNFSADNLDTIIFEGSNKTFAVSRESGEIVWERVGNYTPLDLSKNIAYSKKYGNNAEMEVYDIQTGETRWIRKGFKNAWWGDMDQIVEDTTWIAAGDGVHTFDLKTGEGWDVKIGTNTTGNMGAAIALNIAAAVFGVVGNARADRYDSLTSNALVVDDEVFYAGNRVLVSIDRKTGKELWNIKLPKIAAHSVLHDEDDHILMFGLGWCYKNHRVANYSIPYIARFDKKDGKQLLYKPIGAKFLVNVYEITDEGYYLVSNGKMFFADKSDPENIINSGDNKESVNNFGKILNIVKTPKTYFIADDMNNPLSFKNLTEYNNDDTRIFARTSKGILQYGKNLEVQHFFPDNRVNYLMANNKNVTLIRGVKKGCKDQNKQCVDDNNKSIKIIDMADSGKLKGEIKTVLAAEVFGNSLVLFDHKKIIVQSLDTVYSAFLNDAYDSTILETELKTERNMM